MAFHAEEFAQNFGQRVRRIRKEERLTQLELSYMVGVSDKTIRDIERGKPGPSFGSVLKTAEVLGIYLVVEGADHAYSRAPQGRHL